MRQRARGILCLCLLLPVAAASAVPEAPALATSTVDRVVVYSGEARVFRAATVTLGPGASTFSVADLPAAARADSVRVECDSAEVQHVTVMRSREGLPRQAEAKALLAKIQKVLDALRALGDEEAVLRAEVGFIAGLAPVVQRPRVDKEPPALHVDTWRRVLSWSEGRSAKIRARLAALGPERQALTRQLQPLVTEGKTLQLGAARAAGSRVVVTLGGKPGRHRLAVSYVVDQVRWVAAYDLRYDEREAVDATYYAVVTQATGEDWKDARLSFSTAQPAPTVALPELPTWTLGRRTDFTPTPRPRIDPRPVAWAPPPVEERPDETQLALARVLGDDRIVTALPAGQPAAADEPESLNGRAERDDRKEEIAKRSLPARPGSFQVRVQRKAALEAPVFSGDAHLTAPAPVRMERASRRGWFASDSRRREPEPEEVPWTDQGYVAPTLDPDLPAAAAKGYRYTLDAPGRHTIASTGVAGRVPLVRERFRVIPKYRIAPGRNQAAYLAAEVINGSGRPILRGQANLFVGTMYSGQTQLDTALPGGKLLLPLGVDDRVKVSRITTQRTVTQGVLFKDDVTEYAVQIEIANHRRHPVRVEVEDQVPLVRRDAKLEAFATEVGFTRPDDDGKVTYQGTVGPASVAKLSFRYRIVRSKNWELTHD
jgi:hypothetical protein